MRKIQNLLKIFTFKSTRDNHGSLHLHIQRNMKHQQFDTQLTQILKQQIENKSKALWIFLNKDNCGFISTAFQKGFKIHHGKETDIVLYRWLLQQQPDLVPPFSRFYVGSGGIIINDGKVLMVQEASGNRKNDWGIPGGLSDMNQAISSSTERQIRQQTNLIVKFKYMVYMRQLANTLFDGTDVYYANYVELDKNSLKDMKLCPTQLKGHQWVDLTKTQQFMNTHQVRNTQRYLLSYLAELHKSGFQFDKQTPNSHDQFGILIAGRTKQFREHKFIPLKQ